MLKKIVKLVIAIIFVLFADTAYGQRLAIKANVVDWATLSPQLGLEARLGRRLSLDVSVAGNPFDFEISGVKLNNLRFQPELRYWFNRPMARHFVGFAMLGSTYKLKLRSHHYDGDLFAAGFTYGYSLVLNRHWNMEAEIGVGLGRVRAFKYLQGERKTASPNYNKWVPVPIRIGLSFCYVFDSVK